MATITATPSTEGQPRVLIEITGMVEPGAMHRLVRIDPSGFQSDVRTTSTGLDHIGGTWAGMDYEMPLGVEVTYRLIEPGVIAPYPEATTTADSDGPWLIHPGEPNLSAPIRLLTMTDTGWRARTAALDVIGRADPMVVTSVMARRHGTMQLAVKVGSERSGVYEVFRDGSVLLLRVPQHCKPMLDDFYFATLDVREDPSLTGGDVLKEQRRWLVDYQVCAMPVGPRKAARTWQDVLNDGTWQDVLDKGETWGGVLYGGPPTTTDLWGV